MAFTMEKARRQTEDAAYIAVDLQERYMAALRRHDPRGQRGVGGPSGLTVAGFHEVLKHVLDEYYADPPAKPLTPKVKPDAPAVA